MTVWAVQRVIRSPTQMKGVCAEQNSDNCRTTRSF
ncbi:unnamed protein product [Chondrus crispus]|uniref:Uncharacterized protein n=1 Tax=Chondrus crispus TaxID=2769 RepID=R7QKG1_CHOCR|nr:unnamed protein product [Chondrus crispus]CDF38554.1 unnamed protein product [Chondrus crispus]|eukprot:XP_005718447.1 unnamed protein product [Chondrus crispus]